MSSESVVQQNTRLEYAYNVPAGYLGRNNSGVMTAIDEKTGQKRIVRFGLGNDSKQMNDHIKSSDLIGSTPTLITPEMVGYYLGVFTAIECKPSGWKMTPGDHRAAGQAKFHDIIRASCGFAGFVTDPMDIYPIIGRQPPR